MSTLTRYLLRQHVAPFVFALIALTAIMLLQQVAKRLGDFIGKGLPWAVVAEFFVLALPFIVAMTLPMAVLVAVLYMWSRLAESNEYTAFLASGLSPLRLARPTLLAALGVSLVAFAFTDQVLPRSNHRLRTLMVDIQRVKPNFVLQEQVVNEVVDGRFFLRAARISAASDRLRDVTIYDLQSADRRRVIHADSGWLAYSRDLEDLYLTLYDGAVMEFSKPDPAQFSRTFFGQEVIRVAGVGSSLERTTEDSYRTDRELSVCEMDERIAQAERNAMQAQADLELAVRNRLRTAADLPLLEGDSIPRRRPLLYCRVMAQVSRWLLPAAEAQTPTPRLNGVARTAGDLTSLQRRIEAARRDAASYTVELHKKFAIASACLVFALLGVPLALRFPRGGVGLVIGASLAVFTTYYVGLIAGEDLGDRLIVDPALIMWVPNIVYGLAGLWGLSRLVRGAVPVRSEGLGDLLGRLRQRLPSRPPER